MMNTNDILRRTRYAFDFNDAEMISIFGLAQREVTRAQVSDWLKRDEDPAFVSMTDSELASFLNGLIIKKRGRRDAREPESRLTNNLVLMKLKIALSLKTEDVLELINAGDLNLSQHELSAFFRKPTHRQYRECMDQVLRNFLRGMQLKLRGTDGGEV